MAQPRSSFAVLAALAALATFAEVSQAKDGPPVYAVKATFLYKFEPYVTWPGPASATAANTFNICVVGDDPFGRLLDQAVSSERVGGRPILVRRLGAVDRGQGCQIVYLTGSRTQSVADALRSVRGSPVLTVTDADSSANTKGIIHFVVRDNRVRFEIDDQAAAQNGLVISSKLLSLALSTRPRS